MASQQDEVIERVVAEVLARIQGGGQPVGLAGEGVGFGGYAPPGAPRLGLAGAARGTGLAVGATATGVRLGLGPGGGTGVGAATGTGRGLGAGGGVGLGSGVAAARRPVGGNMGALFNDESGSARSPVTRRAGPMALVVLTAGDAHLDEVYRQLGLLGEQGGVTVFLSPSARQVLDLAAIRRACPRAEILPNTVTHELRDLVEGASVVYLPTLTLSTASKIALLDGDTAASLLPIFALMRSKAVVASPQAIFGLRDDYPPPPEGFRRRVEEILEGLRAVGVQIVDLAHLAGVGTGSAPASGAGGLPRTLAPAPLPAPSTTASSASSTGCSLSSDGTCEGCGQCAKRNEGAVQALVNGGAARVGAAPGTQVTNRGLASMIDHTLLRADATEAEIRALCAEAREYQFASVCINPGWVAVAAEELSGSPVKVCTVIGFPLGATTATAKAIESRDAIANGATEVDMVINVGALKSGDDDRVRRDIEAVVAAARGQALVKVILETALLSREEKVKACLLAKMAGADFVKTSTGFSTGGATVEDIALMRETVGPEMGVKASGGIRSAEDAQAMIAAGATRIGASASVAIARGTGPDSKTAY